MFQRYLTTRSRAVCRQRHTIAAAITDTDASLSIQPKKRRDAMNYSCRRYYQNAVRLTPLVSLPAGKANTLAKKLAKYGVRIRTFKSVGDYHDVAEETLNHIQDTVEDYLEDRYDAGVAEKEDEIPEVNYASGVMTIHLPSHGTWIINKQTPNQQLWWSSPISGPRRYEYNEKRERWVYSRGADGGSAAVKGGEVSGEEDTLGGILNNEFLELFGEDLGTEDDAFHC